MARCPACFRLVSYGDLIRQARAIHYRCAKCDRQWRFQSGTLAIAVALSLSPLLFVVLQGETGVTGAILAALAACAASAAIYLTCIILFGKLVPVRRSHDDRR